MYIFISVCIYIYIYIHEYIENYAALVCLLFSCTHGGIRWLDTVKGFGPTPKGARATKVFATISWFVYYHVFIPFHIFNHKHRANNGTNIPDLPFTGSQLTDTNELKVPQKTWNNP